jgi:ureidoglycolate dehydrogenase (NAD+)
MAKPRVRVAAGDLQPLAAAILASGGLSPEDAQTTAAAFVWANLRGIDSHGVSRVPRYLELLAGGEANATAQMRTERPRPGVILVDADRAPGPVALSHAMRAAMDAARETGIAVANVRGTVHTGAIGYYTSRAAAEGMVGIAIVAGMPNMGYQGARGAAVATSPLSIAIPASKHPGLLLDMATAAIALGKITQAANNGTTLPEGVAVTAEGEPTTDPTIAKIPLPAAGAKGSGMSLSFELLASGLADHPIVGPFHTGTPDGRRHKQNALLIAIDVSAFVALDAFTGTVDATLDTVKGLPPAGDGTVMYPGERGAAAEEERRRDGIPLPVALWGKLTAAAEAAGIDVPEPLVAAPATQPAT